MTADRRMEEVDARHAGFSGRLVSAAGRTAAPTAAASTGTKPTAGGLGALTPVATVVTKPIAAVSAALASAVSATAKPGALHSDALPATVSASKPAPTAKPTAGKSVAQARAEITARVDAMFGGRYRAECEAWLLTWLPDAERPPAKLPTARRDAERMGHVYDHEFIRVTVRECRQVRRSIAQAVLNKGRKRSGTSGSAGSSDWRAARSAVSPSQSRRCPPLQQRVHQLEAWMVGMRQQLARPRQQELMAVHLKRRVAQELWRAKKVRAEPSPVAKQTLLAGSWADVIRGLRNVCRPGSGADLKARFEAATGMPAGTIDASKSLTLKWDEEVIMGTNPCANTAALSTVASAAAQPRDTKANTQPALAKPPVASPPPAPPPDHVFTSNIVNNAVPSLVVDAQGRMIAPAQLSQASAPLAQGRMIIPAQPPLAPAQR